MTYTVKMTSLNWTSDPARVLDVFKREVVDNPASEPINLEFREIVTAVVHLDGRLGVRYELVDDQISGVVLAFPVDDAWECSVWVLPSKESDSDSAALSLAVLMTEPASHEVLLTQDSWHANVPYDRMLTDIEDTDGMTVIVAFSVLVNEVFALLHTEVIREVLVGFHPREIDYPRACDFHMEENASTERFVCYVSGEWLGYYVMFSYIKSVAIVEVRRYDGLPLMWSATLRLTNRDSRTLMRDQVRTARDILADSGFGSILYKIDWEGVHAVLSEDELASLFGLLMGMLTVSKYTFTFHALDGWDGDRPDTIRVSEMTLAEAIESIQSNPTLHMYDVNSAEPDTRVFPEVMPVFPVKALSGW